MWKKITENEFSFSIPGKSFKIETVVLPIPDKNGKITKYKANVLFKGFLVLEKEAVKNFEKYRMEIFMSNNSRIHRNRNFLRCKRHK
jgi:hypothetical protein